MNKHLSQSNDDDMEEPLLVEESFIFDDNNRTSQVSPSLSNPNSQETAFSM